MIQSKYASFFYSQTDVYDIIIHLVFSEGLILLLLPETQPLVDGGVILPYYFCSHY